MLPRILEAGISPRRSGISFLAQPGPPIFSNGVEIGLSEIALHTPGSWVCQRLSGPSRWSAISLPADDWPQVSAAILGRDITPPMDLARVVASEAGLAELRRLHAATVKLAQDAPEIIANPDAARALDAELIVALAETLNTIDGQTATNAWRHHAAIIKRFRCCLEETGEQPLYLSELCTTLGISERTLRLCCHESFGMGPKQYLHLRRLGLARRQLQRPASCVASVTSVATEFGFWELGRFAVEYRRSFGESPSTTLRNARASRPASPTGSAMNPPARGADPSPVPKLHSANPAAGICGVLRDRVALL